VWIQPIPDAPVAYGSSILFAPADLFLNQSVQRVFGDFDNLAVVEGVPRDVVQLWEEVFAVDVEAAVLAIHCQWFSKLMLCVYEIRANLFMISYSIPYQPIGFIILFQHDSRKRRVPSEGVVLPCFGRGQG
jgi:hypothetical protein